MEHAIQGSVRRANLRSGKCHLENSPSGKCLFGELSIWGTVLQGTVCRENVFGELSSGK